MTREDVLEAFQVLEGLSSGYLTRDKILDRYRGSSRALMEDVVDFSVEQGILVILGTVYLRRQKPTKEHIDTFLTSQVLQNPSSRLQHAHEEIEALLHGVPTHPWLEIQFERMPTSTRTELHRRAVQVLGARATEGAVKTQMVRLAARALRAAFRVQTP